MSGVKHAESVSRPQAHPTVAALKQSEERLKLALESSMMGLWEWNIETNHLYWSDELKKLYGLQLDEPVSYDKFMACVYHEDREFIATTIEQHKLSGEMYEVEHRILLPDNTIHWVLGKGRSYFENGIPIRMIGTSTNIDSVKQAKNLAESNAVLKKQRTQLMALNRTKDDFIALASHQLRTPATAVKQYISLLLNEFAGPISADQEQLLQVAYNSNERQLNIINDLLKTAQIDSNRYTLEKTRQDISQVVRSCVDELEDTFASRQQTVSCSGLEPITLNLDMSEIKLVITNLLENASKYSYPRTAIHVEMKKKKDHIEIAFKDQGVGLNKADHKRIFEKFTRVNNELSDTVSGNGFGLYWVKRLLALHGGSIKINSELGAGSTFTITLPL